VQDTHKCAERPRAVESLPKCHGSFFVSLVALVGVFSYNTISVSVVQRRREIGILRCQRVTPDRCYRSSCSKHWRWPSPVR
jgi:hypothetical protein